MRLVGVPGAGVAGLRVLLVGRSLRGYEGLMAEAFAELGFDVLFLGYEDIWRSLYGGAPGWLGGIFLRRLLISSASRECMVWGFPALRLYNWLAVRLAELFEPELVFVVKGEALSSSTLKMLARLVPAKRLSYFNPDDPRYSVLVGIHAEAGFQVFTACHPCLRSFRGIYG